MPDPTDPATLDAAAAAAPAKAAKAKVADAPASPFVMQRVTNNTDGPVSINTQGGQQMLAPGDSGEALIHENEGTINPIDGLDFELV